jgi:hypothetical protein
VRADPAQHPGQGQILHDNLQSFFVFTLLDHLHVALDIQASGTGQAARSLIRLLNGKSTGDRLGVLLERGFFAGKPFVVFIGKGNGTDLGALPAAGAFGYVYVARTLTDLGLETPLFPLEFQKIAVRQKLYVQMPADLDQFGRDNSHRTVIGGEGLVQLGHQSTDGGRLFHEVHQVSGVGKIQGCLHSGDTASHDQNGSADDSSHVVLLNKL